MANYCPYCSQLLPDDTNSANQKCPSCGRSLDDSGATFAFDPEQPGDEANSEATQTISMSEEIPVDPSATVALPNTIQPSDSGQDESQATVALPESLDPAATIGLDENTASNAPDATLIIDHEQPAPEANQGDATYAMPSLSADASGSLDVNISDDQLAAVGTNEAPSAANFDFDETVEGSAIDPGLARTVTEDLDGSKENSNPLQTIKSRGDQSGVLASSDGDMLDTVPFRALGQRSKSRTDLQSPEYELIKVLGEGGMGVVWSARQASVDRHVAIKMIKGPHASKATQRKKFLSEAVVTGDLDHPNIVPIYDVGRDAQGTLFYSMKQVQGTPWQKVIREKSESENIDILLRVADAMAFAHSRGIVHRDLKPENIMLGEFGEVLVMDWGLALATGDLEKARRLRQSTSMGGTPAYMAPEMATGPIDNITGRSDVYLLGAILWEIVTGRPPHPGKGVQECLLAAVRNDITPTERQGEIVDIAYKAMAKNPKERFAAVRDFQTAIRGYLSHTESIAMVARAESDLQQGRKSSNYSDYSKAVFGFQEALLLWSGNQAAKEGIHRANLAYAECAFAKGDYDLAASLLNADRVDHQELRQQITSAQSERDARQSRLAFARRAMTALVALILVVVSVAFFWIRGERNEAIRQKGIAEKQTELAIQAGADLRVALDETEQARSDEEAQRKIAQTNAENAERQRRIAVANAEEAERQRQAALEQEKLAKKNADEAERQRKEAVKQEMLARQSAAEALKQKGLAEANATEAAKQEKIAKANAQEAVRQQKIAELNADEAKKQQQAAERESEARQYQAYIARIGLASAKVEENAFDVAEGILDESPKALRNWEWGRLRHLCNQSSQKIEASAPVDGIAVSPNGKQFVMATWDGVAQIVDVESLAIVRQLKIDGLYVHSVDWHRDVIATGGSDAEGYIRLWNASTGNELSHFTGHKDAVVDVTFSPDGRWLLTTSYDGTARLWDISEPRQPTEALALDGHSWWVWEGAFSPGFDPFNSASKSQIVTASQDGKAIVWDVAASSLAAERQVSTTGDRELTASIATTFSGHQGPVYSVAVNSDNIVATGGYDGRILLWKPEDVPPVSLDELLNRQPPTVNWTECRGHIGPVQTVAFSSRGDVLISGGRDNAVIVWDTSEGRSLKSFRGHSSEVRSVRFTPDDSRIISGGKDKLAIVWGIEDYEEIRSLHGRSLEGHADAILSARFSADGSQVVTAGRDRVAILWDVKTGTQLREFSEGHEFLASRAVLSPNRQILFTAAADNTVRVWDVATGGQRRVLKGTGQSAVLAISPDGNWLATGNEESGACIYRIPELLDLSNESLEPAVCITGHNGPVTSAAFVAGEKLRMATCDTHGRCVLTDIATGEIIWNVKHHAGRVTDVAVRPSDSQLLTASHDHTVGILNLETGEEIATLPVEAPVSSLAISPDGSQALTTSPIPQSIDPTGSRIALWDINERKPLNVVDSRDFSVAHASFTPKPDTIVVTCSDNTVRLLKLGGDSSPFRLPLLEFSKLRSIVWNASFTNDGRELITLGGNEARIWDAQTLREQMRFSPHGAVSAAAFSPDGNLLVTGSWDNSAKIWDVTNGTALRKLVDGHRGFINSAEFSPDGQSILTAGDDGIAVLWETSTGKVIRRFEGHQDRVRSATFNTDGSRILTTSNDKTAIIWDVEKGTQIRTLKGHSWSVLCGEFSEDGQRVVTGSEDNSAILWSAETGERITTFTGHISAVTGVGFSRDAHRVFTASQDTTAKLWDTIPGHEGVEILTLKNHSRELTDLDVSPDGRNVLTSSRDGRAVLWLTSPWDSE
ncbi:MAG: protein kinase [Planctomycetaceae bacterium]